MTTSRTETTGSRTKGRTGARVAGLLGIVALLGVAMAWLLGSKGEETVSVAPTESVSPEQLRTAAGARVFLGHQSVGANLLDGVAAVYAAEGVTAPEITSDPAGVRAASGGVLAHAYIGENTKPLDKIADFDSKLRGGLAEQVGIAAMKLCYIDFNASTDVDALFSRYQETMAALEQDFPDVTFLYITTPLTTEASGWKASVKGLLGRPDPVAADNVVREQYNELLREAYGRTGRLFDLAAIESTAPDGSRVSGEYQGSTYYALAPQYAADPGHLNAAGAQVAAAKFLALVAQVS